MSSEFRKVLIIAYYFPPMGLSGVQRTAKFVKYLPKYRMETHSSHGHTDGVLRGGSIIARRS